MCESGGYQPMQTDAMWLRTDAVYLLGVQYQRIQITKLWQDNFNDITIN